MSKRLVKVAKELNVGTKTIVEFLNGNGFAVSNKPTAKISDEMYDALAKNFQNSIAIKEKANQITIGTRKTKEEPLKEKVKSEEGEEEQQQEVQDAPKVVEQTPTPVVEAVPEVVEEKKEEQDTVESKAPQLTGPKILGKINLDNQNKKGRRKVQEPKEEKTVEKVTPKDVVEPPKEKTVETKNTPEQKPVKKIEEPVVEKQQEPKQEVIDPKKETPKEEVAKDVIVPAEQKDTPTKDKDSNSDLDIKVDAPQLKGLKILGKINIASSKPKRKKKTKDNRRGAQGQGNSDPKKKNLVASSDSGQGQKKRRKRTRVKTDGNTSNNKTGNESSNQNKNTTSTSSNKSSSDDNKRKVFKKPDKPAANAGKRGKKKGRRKEIDEKEIGNKLKATMNLLGGRGGKKKKFGASRKERDEQRAERLREIENNSEEAPKIQVTEFISVSELASLMNISATDIIMACMNEKRMVSINQRMDRELIELMGIEFGYEVEFVSAEDQMEKDYQIEDDELEDNSPRSPIVTVMGHVDHGKTSLLDSIRKANVAGGEAGGITQHIGAYEVKVGDQGTITFLDTPGHEAFTAMRARGAKVTDVAVIIISADDSIMPQTKEAISHAQAAEVPIIFAINKIDKEGANPDKIKQELASMDLLIEEWGGKYQSQDISAKQGLNIDLLLEKILLESEMLELKANPEKRAVGTVLEASLEKGRGYVAKILVRNGTLSVGDAMVAGPHYGRVKAMFNERGKRVKSAGPATPVLVLGLQGAPQAGETINVLASEKEAKDLAGKRANLVRQQQIRATRRVTLDDITNRIKIGNFRELNLIVKGDFDGSVEALSDSLLKLSTDQVQTNIIYQAVGPVTESDVNLAAASNAIIVGFQVRPNPMAKRLAENEGVEINTYSIIYDAIDEIKSALEGMLEPKQVEEITGMVDVQQVFKISKVGAVAGCFVQEGKVTRNSYVRVIRDGIVEYPKKEGVHGELSSLRRFKDSVSEVKNGFECGITLKNYNDLKEGDVLEIYDIKEVKQTL
ncbi:translation initiation factor IF-2 [Aureispira anguillae]|uniref:Translation initiation factor IF-2 n=1 Tax=Aureispira anguillae TaxID=2864201 RepID=A0A915YK03_9BACT|nr:translation initiation factor IF-2 [Aureispira anguillae]BDS14638.1 translation initiation factor IF-2 [Aureispira anguillae]